MNYSRNNNRKKEYVDIDDHTKIYDPTELLLKLLTPPESPKVGRDRNKIGSTVLPKFYNK